MARYQLYGLSNSLFKPNAPGPIGPRLLYVNATEFAIQNDDGSRSYFRGTGLVYDAAQGFFTDGVITQVLHYDSAGRFVDSLRADAGAVLVDAGSLQSFLENPTSLPLGFGTDLDSNLLAGNDVIDARYRANNAVVNDTLHGQTGNDVILGGSGNDFVSGGYGNDSLFGGTGNDKLVGGDYFLNAENEFLGGIGNDVLRGEDGDDFLLGGYGADALHGGAGTDMAVYAGTFAALNVVKTAAGFTVVSPLDGTDTLTGVERIAADDGVWSFANGAWTKLNGAPGVAYMRPASVYLGTSGSDTIADLADAKKNIVYGLGGDDTINMAYTYGEKIAFGGLGNDTIVADIGGNSSAARLYGEAGNDTLSGTLNGDYLSGGAGDDSIDGGYSGNDIILGGAGMDSITGGRGSDTLTGGTQADVFNFAVEQTSFGGGIHETGWENDTITDFQLGVDHLHITQGVNAPVLTSTAEGLMITVDLHLAYSVPFNTAAILLKGVHGAGITLADLLI